MAASNPSATTPPKNIDFSSPTACTAEKEVHNKCFYAWMQDKFLQGKAQKDDCETQWLVYQDCLQHKLKAHGLSQLLDKNHKESFHFELKAPRKDPSAPN